MARRNGVDFAELLVSADEELALELPNPAEYFRE
jgi:hypothetical protein